MVTSAVSLSSFMQMGRGSSSAYVQGFQAGYRGPDTSWGLDWYAPSSAYMEWYRGYQAGRARAEAEAVEMDRIPPKWARNYANYGRRVS